MKYDDFWKGLQAVCPDVDGCELPVQGWKQRPIGQLV